MNTLEKILRITDLQQLGFSKTAIRNWEASGHLPKRTVFGPKFTGWPESEIKDWLRSRPRRGDASTVGSKA
jgi:predicted DNA-binding transcriptional regulator AlpA